MSTAPNEISLVKIKDSDDDILHRQTEIARKKAMKKQKLEKIKGF
jgi:hypothetical protein